MSEPGSGQIVSSHLLKLVLGVVFLTALAMLACSGSDGGSVSTPTVPLGMFSTLPTSEPPVLGDQPPTVELNTPEPTLTPQPTPTLNPTYTPVPTPTPLPTRTPTPNPTDAPVPTPTSNPTGTPVPTATPNPTGTPVPTADTQSDRHTSADGRHPIRQAHQCRRPRPIRQAHQCRRPHLFPSHLHQHLTHLPRHCPQVTLIFTGRFGRGLLTRWGISSPRERR